jgi:hypothetical protein
MTVICLRDMDEASVHRLQQMAWQAGLPLEQFAALLLTEAVLRRDAVSRDAVPLTRDGPPSAFASAFAKATADREATADRPEVQRAPRGEFRSPQGEIADQASVTSVLMPTMPMNSPFGAKRGSARVSSTRTAPSARL